jgi:malate dehydrogenase (oxaloacetate-decarboxylating)
MPNNDSLELHKNNQGKLSIISKIPIKDRETLSLVYTPGVASVCEAIAKIPELAREYTIKRNTVAVVTDGSSVLGLGNIGPLAALPVMEGKAAIFKEFGNVDAFPICLDTQDTEEIIRTVKLIAPVFGGINLEDISAPRCFEIEERLRKELSIPVMHDDQWGAATVTLAALITALRLREIPPAEAKVVISGVGAAGVATGRLLQVYGIKNIVFCDSKGIIHAKRSDLTKEKIELLQGSIAIPGEGDLAVALKDAHIFIGLSKPNVVTKEMVISMSERPILFTLANPTPEIMPEDAKSAGAFIIATGRSDYPNQINNSLVFPGAFKAMLDLNIPQFSNDIFIVIAEALSKLIVNPAPDQIIPSMFDKEVFPTVYAAVANFSKW